jgi:hypothetical protein
MDRPMVEITRCKRATDVDGIFSGKLDRALTVVGVVLAAVQVFLLKVELYQVGGRTVFVLVVGCILGSLALSLNSRILRVTNLILVAVGLGHLLFLFALGAAVTLWGLIHGDAFSIGLTTFLGIGGLFSLWQTRKGKRPSI